MARLYEVLLSGVTENQRFNMRLNYLAAGTPSQVKGAVLLSRAIGLVDESGIIPGWQLPEGSVLLAFANLVTTNTWVDRVDVVNVYDPLDFLATPVSPIVQGVNNLTALPEFCAYKFTSSVSRRDIRPGQKAVPGVAEDYQNNGTITGEAVGKGLAFAAAISAVLTPNFNGAADSFVPCVASKVRYEVEGKGTFAYRYRPETGEGNQFEYLATEIVYAMKPRVTTQNSRKTGRGI